MIEIESKWGSKISPALFLSKEQLSLLIISELIVSLSCTSWHPSMNVTTDDEALIELYLRGKTSDKRYKKMPVQAVKGFKKAVDIIKAVDRIEDLFRFNGLRYERLIGDRKGQESVRCNDTWRLIFKSYPQEGSVVITEICLIEISHHYG